ncbi:hypothetical protein ASF45_27930 [Pseudorhodoferax sp. Leaf265]|nr:hypothetical protein ASF45_27930 [Pseudorhodoferax sp. Leaf265]
MDNIQHTVFNEAVSETALDIDAQIVGLTREAALQLPVAMRLRWFYLRQIKHAKLLQVYRDLSELLEPTNDVTILSLVGMTGIGKTTLAQQIVPRLIERYGDVPDNEIPVIYVKVPANGDRATSWKALYQRMFTGAREILGNKRIVLDKETEKQLRYTTNKRASLTNLREVLEPLFENRKVRVLILDEAAHLARFQDYAATMDTLKSLSDIGNIKILLIGSYDIVELVSDYGQVTRRGEVVHYRRYAVAPKPDEGKEGTVDQRQFQDVLAAFEAVWPSHNVPNLQALWHEWMHQCLGSVGLLKLSLLRLAALQLHAKGEQLNVGMLKKIFKTPKALQQLEREAAEGENELVGRCYGDCGFDAEKLAFLHQMMNQKGA